MSDAGGRNGGLLTALALATAILVLGVPRLFAAIWDSFHDDTVGLVYAGMPVSRGDLRGLVASRRLALGWVPSGKGQTELAAAYLALAQDPSMADEEEAAEQLMLARAATRAALALAPSDARGWLQHAYLAMLEAGRATPEAIAALDLASRISPYDSAEIVATRLHLALIGWAMLGDAARARVIEQMHLAWRLAPRRVLDLAAEPGFAPLLAFGLADDELAQELLEPLLARAAQPEI